MVRSWSKGDISDAVSPAVTGRRDLPLRAVPVAAAAAPGLSREVARLLWQERRYLEVISLYLFVIFFHLLLALFSSR